MNYVASHAYPSVATATATASAIGERRRRRQQKQQQGQQEQEQVQEQERLCSHSYCCRQHHRHVHQKPLLVTGPAALFNMVVIVALIVAATHTLALPGWHSFATVDAATLGDENREACLVPRAGLKSRSGRRAAPAVVDLKVTNNYDTAAHLMWVNFEGIEQGLQSVPAGGSITQSTHVGHAWRLRALDDASSPLLGEFVVQDEMPNPLRVSLRGCMEWGARSLFLPLPKVPKSWLADESVSVSTVAADKEKEKEKEKEKWEKEDGEMENMAAAAPPASCAPELWLSERKTQGFHVLCLTDPTESERALGASARVFAYKGGVLSEPGSVRSSTLSSGKGDDGLIAGSRGASHVFLLPGAGTAASSSASTTAAAASSKMLPATAADLVSLVILHLQLKLYASRQPPRLFTERGELLATASRALTRRVLYFFEGGQWVWPAVRIGHRVSLGALRFPNETVYLTTRSLQPRIFEVTSFLRDSECDSIIADARPHIANSGVATKDADQGRDATDWRVSKQYFMNSHGRPFMQTVERRVQDLMRVPATHAEDAQILLYGPNGFYSAHHDYFNPGEYANNPSMMSLIAGGRRNRMATVFFYLSNVTRGGHTGFPRAGGLPTPHDYKDCTRGVSVAPQKGKIIIFYNLHPDGQADEYSLHGGCNVEEGEKWSANFWLWNEPNPSRPSPPAFYTDAANDLIGTALPVAEANANVAVPLPPSRHTEL
eukprot:UC1_evm1s635